jgi:hypothetical protein
MKNSTIEARLAHLEAQNRTLRRTGLTLAVLLGALPIVSFALPDEPKDATFRIVRASKFSLEDPRTGKVRGEFSHQVMAGGWAGITLWDDEGRPRAEFKLWEDGRTTLSMTDAERRTKFAATVDPQGVVSLTANGAAVPLE